jgi:hypothetical protein
MNVKLTMNYSLDSKTNEDSIEEHLRNFVHKTCEPYWIDLE